MYVYQNTKAAELPDRIGGAGKHSKVSFVVSSPLIIPVEHRMEDQSNTVQCVTNGAHAVLD